MIRATNLERLKQFYCDVVGCKLEKTNERLGLVHLRAGTTLIDLISVDGTLGLVGGAAPGKEGRNLDHLCLRIDPFDFSQLKDYFAEQGIDIGEVHENYGAEGDGYSIYFSDPENNVIELKGPAFA